MINDRDGEENYNKTLKCIKCENYLELLMINEKEVIFLCSNKYCSFPLDSEHMNKYIFNRNELSLQSVERLKTITIHFNTDLLRKASYSSDINFNSSDNEYK